MKASSAAPKNIDDYIAGFSPAIQAILEKIRVTIKKAAPAAEEKISHRMPAFTLQGEPIGVAEQLLRANPRLGGPAQPG